MRRRPEPGEMVVCGMCLHPVGIFFDEEGTPLAALNCRCERLMKATRSTLARWDSIHEWENVGRRSGRRILCRGCAREWLPDQHRMAVWFCDRCRPIVRGINTAMGRLLLPLGRHSLVNGVHPTPVDELPAGAVEVALLLSGDDPGEPAAVSAAQSGVARHVARSVVAVGAARTGLDRHQAEETRRVIARHDPRAAESPPFEDIAPGSGRGEGLALPDDVPIGTYLAWAATVEEPTEAPFLRLAARWTGRSPTVDT